MGNIDINQIRLKGFEPGSKSAKIEDMCRKVASQNTDKILEYYKRLEASRNGRYINSDLMKMVFPFYSESIENRRLYNLSITNTAAVLTNEAYKRAIQSTNIERCVFVVGPYGAGKSFFIQSLFESSKEDLLANSIVYEGSITPPAFEEKIAYAIEHGVQPDLIAINPTLKLSMQNIQQRAKTVGRDVEKKEVVDKFSNFYTYFKALIDKFPNVPYTIYNKEANLSIKLDGGSKNVEDLNHGTYENISSEYDRIEDILKETERNK